MVVKEFLLIPQSRFLPPNGSGAQLRGTGRLRSLRHPRLMPDSTKAWLERAVPRRPGALLGGALHCWEKRLSKRKKRTALLK